MAEGLRPAVGLTRWSPSRTKRPSIVSLQAWPRGEPDVLYQHQLGRREAVVDFGHADLLARVLDARPAAGAFADGVANVCPTSRAEWRRQGDCCSRDDSDERVGESY